MSASRAGLSGLVDARRAYDRLHKGEVGVEEPRVIEVADVRTLTECAGACGASMERRSGRVGFEFGGYWFSVKGGE